MRIGAVSTYAPDSDIDEVDVCRRISFGHANVASWNIGFVMKTKRKIAAADVTSEAAETEFDAWERRNAPVVKKQLAQAWKAYKNGKAVVFDPRDPYAIIREGRRNVAKLKKA